MQDFRKLKVWEKSHRLVLELYRVSSGFPQEERYGLTNQLRRAAASIPTNIAEGCGRGTQRELAHFLMIARGSASEADYLLELTASLGFLGEEEKGQLAALLEEVKCMLAALHARVRSNVERPTSLGEEPAVYGLEETLASSNDP
jgi:four helix bundle protein